MARRVNKTDAFKTTASEFKAQVQAIQDRLQSMIDGPSAREAMEKAVQVLRTEATELTPVDSGKLINSQYSNVSVEGKRVVGRVGYSTQGSSAALNSNGTPYAFFVHQNVLGNVPSRDNPVNPPRAQPFFLTGALQNKREEIINIIKNGVFRA